MAYEEWRIAQKREATDSKEFISGVHKIDALVKLVIHNAKKFHITDGEIADYLDYAGLGQFAKDTSYTGRLIQMAKEGRAASSFESGLSY